MVIAEHTARIGERHLDSSFKRLPLRETVLDILSTLRDITWEKKTSLVGGFNPSEKY